MNKFILVAFISLVASTSFASNVSTSSESDNNYSGLSMAYYQYTVDYKATKSSQCGKRGVRC